MIIRHAHQSGHVTASAAQQAAMLERFTAACSVGVVTEATSFGAPPEGWRWVGTETVIPWDVSQWSLPPRRTLPGRRLTEERHGTLVIETPPWHRGKRRETTVEIEWAALASVVAPDFTLLRFGGHLPAHLFRAAQRKANAAALRGLAPALAPVIAAHKPDEVTGSFDFNRPLTNARHAKLITDAVAPLGLRLVVPPKATRGLRTIDGFLTTSRLVEADMLRRMPGYDHRGARLHTCADCGGQA